MNYIETFNKIYEYLNDSDTKNNLLEIVKIQMDTVVRKYILLCIVNESVYNNEMKEIINEFIKKHFIEYIFLLKLSEFIEDSNRVELLGGGVLGRFTQIFKLMIFLSLAITIFSSDIEKLQDSTQLVEYKYSNNILKKDASTITAIIVSVSSLFGIKNILQNSVNELNELTEKATRTLKYSCKKVLQSDNSVEYFRTIFSISSESTENNDSNAMISSTGDSSLYGFFSSLTVPSPKEDSYFTEKRDLQIKHNELKSKAFEVCEKSIPNIYIYYENNIQTGESGISGFQTNPTFQLKKMLGELKNNPDISEKEKHIADSLLEYGNKIEIFTSENNIGNEKQLVNKINGLKEDLSKILKNIVLSPEVVRDIERKIEESAQEKALHDAELKRQEEKLLQEREINKLTEQQIITEKETNELNAKSWAEYTDYITKQSKRFAGTFATITYDFSIGIIGDFTGKSVDEVLRIIVNIMKSPPGLICILTFFTILVSFHGELLKFILLFFSKIPPFSFVYYFVKPKKLVSSMQTTTIVTEKQDSELVIQKTNIKPKKTGLYFEAKTDDDQISLTTNFPKDITISIIENYINSYYISNKKNKLANPSKRNSSSKRYSKKIHAYDKLKSQYSVGKAHRTTQRHAIINTNKTRRKSKSKSKSADKDKMTEIRV
jgi:hypothetical protein